jgi:hypothetical protein
MAQRDPEIPALTLAGLLLHEFGFGIGDLVDERDVLTFLELEVLALAAHRHAVAVGARIVPEQVVDGVDPEVRLQRVRGLGPDDEVQPVDESGHRYSTPISRASPW